MWKKWARQVALITLLAAIILVLIRVGYGFGWTGFSAAGDSKAQPYQPAKTLWDWLQLLIIPVVLAAGGLWFNVQQSERQQRLSDEQHKQEVELAEKHRLADIELAQEQQRENALQTYLDRMAELLLQGKLRESQEDSDIRQVARARTLTVLPRLDKERKTVLFRFLAEANLVGKDHNIISLSRADLSEANLSWADLIGANLYMANLTWANLTWATMNMANLKGANLSGANLSDASLWEADLTGANLTGATITSEQWIKARSLGGATLPDGSKHP